MPDLEFEEFARSTSLLEDMVFLPQYPRCGYKLILKLENYHRARRALLPWLKAHNRDFDPIWHIPIKDQEWLRNLHLLAEYRGKVLERHRTRHKPVNAF